ncbi:MAG TPA: zf-HC2 domain-containing protein [Gammaproteobacteria bacterium]
MLNCKKATQLMSQKQDRLLSMKERTSLRFHLLMCSGCRNYNQQMALLSVACKHISGEEPEKNIRGSK